MANRSNTSGAVPPGKAGTGELDPPPSLPLQIFLFCAFLVTVAAYVVSQRSQPSDTETAARAQNDRLHRLIMEKTKYDAFTRNGFQAEYQKHFDEAVSDFQNAIGIQDTGEARYNLANALLLQSKTNEAFAQFQIALGLNPKLRDVYTSWGQALMDQGKAEGAERVYRQAIEQNPEFSLTHFKLALALEARKKNAEALEEYAQAARLGLNDPGFFLQFGSLLNREGKFAQAETYLTNAAALKPDLPNVQFELALAQQNQGKLAEAISRYEAMLARNPAHPESLNNLALIYATATKAELRSPKMAISLATRASSAAGDKNTRFLDTLARSYAADGDFLQAAVWENKAVEQARQSGDPDLVRELTARQALFQQHKAE
jgi:tetratricopeptide (TPR) repeat protein